MSEPIRININPVDLEDQKITECSELYLEIKGHLLTYSCKFYADEPKDPEDKSLGWVNFFNRVYIVTTKDKISGMEKSFIPRTNHWGVYVLVPGFQEAIRVFFKKEKDADEVFTKIFNWLYGYGQ